MTLPNHIAGGFVFTGVFSGIVGINILEHPTLLLVTLVASTVADVDVPSSLWGRILKPVSKAINRRYGHRTLTHSLLFMCSLCALVWAICRITGAELPYPTVFLLGYLSHLIFDMMTVQGVLLFYPYSKSPCVIPGDPHLRLQTNKPSSELAVFGFFLVSGLFMQPLMADGFWTSYNRLFGTLAHLQSEFEKADDLLLVDYRYREAAQEYTGSGYAIEATGTSATLWSEQRGWEYLDGSPTSSRTILEVIPTHTEQSYRLVRQSFVGITADSLERLLAYQPIYQLQFSSNKKLEAVYEAQGERNQVRQTRFNLSLVEHLEVEELSSGKVKKEVSYQSSPRLATLVAREKKLRRQHASTETKRHKHTEQLADLERELQETSDIYQRTQLLEELASLRKLELNSDQLSDQLREIVLQIREVEAEDAQRHRERVAAAEEAYTQDHTPIQLTGMVTLVEF